MDKRATGVLSSAEAKDFFSSLCVCVQTSSEAHPASYPMGDEDPYPGDKVQPERDADHSTHLVSRSRMKRSYIASPLCRQHGSSRTALLYFITAKQAEEAHKFSH
jgi:hypothetical protein